MKDLNWLVVPRKESIVECMCATQIDLSRFISISSSDV